jgi:hypothetical protein
MKTLIFAGFLSMLAITGFSQNGNTGEEQKIKTIFNVDKGGDRIVHGGYGAILMNYTQIDNKDAFLSGIRGMWIINHGIGIGFGGYGFANDLMHDSYNYSISDYSLAGGYGGLTIEPIIGAKQPVHVSIPMLFGAGGIASIQRTWNPYPVQSDQYYTGDEQVFMVFEPGIELELNVVKFFRIAFGGYYRFVSDFDLLIWNGHTYDVIKPELEGFSGGITLKFGKF